MRSSVLLAALPIVLGASAARAAGPLPPLPSDAKSAAPASAAPAAQAPAADAPGSDVPAALDKVRRGVVLVEENGRLVGFGTVLGGDGRILTSLSSLGPADGADVIYADGARVHAKVGHKDATWDLALLVPSAIHSKDGLSPGDADPAGSDLRAPIPTHLGGKPIALPVHFKGRTDALSLKGDSLLDAMDVQVTQPLPIAGAPILDAQGSVVGILVHACKLAAATGDAARMGPIACAPTVVGAPVSAVRSFLAHTPASAAPVGPWLGIVGEEDASGSVHGVRVRAVAPQSPAMKAGLHGEDDDGAADRIIAVDGAPVDTPAKLADAIGKHAPGDKVKLLVLGGDAPDHAASFRDVAVTLQAAP